jgi:hypothetical protein
MIARLALIAVLALAPPAPAQQSGEGPSRPAFLAAMGLLQTREETVRHPRAPDIVLALPSSDQVQVRRGTPPEGAEDVVATWEFVGDGGVLETLTLTLATVEPAPPEARRFAMANLLVLRSYAELSRRVPSARLIGFGPVGREGALDAVQAVGAFETEAGRNLVFRHVGLMAEGREEALVAIVTIDASRMPVRTDGELRDTYAGHAVASIRLAPDQTPPEGE